MIDWDDAFDNSSYVEGSDRLADRWSAAAADYRAGSQAHGFADIDLRYGTQSRNQLDLFGPEGHSNGLIIFIHGGYWHLLDKSCWSHLARAAVEAGWCVAIPSYSLAPAARISQITREIARVIEFAANRINGPLRLIGHSAGGHLVTRMVCDDSGLPADVLARLDRVIAVSGIYDLRPLTLTGMNETLQLTDDESRDESPALHRPLPGIQVTCWVGAAERPEFLRQARLLTETWKPHNHQVRDFYEPGENHFSVIENMALPASALFKELTS